MIYTKMSFAIPLQTCINVFFFAISTMGIFGQVAILILLTELQCILLSLCVNE